MATFEIELDGNTLSETLIQDSDFLSSEEFDQAVIAVFEQKISDEVEKAISEADIPELVRNEVPDYDSEIANLEEKFQNLRHKVIDNSEGFDSQIDNFNKMINNLTEINTHLFETIKHLEDRLTEVGRFENRLYRVPIIGRYIHWWMG